MKTDVTLLALLRPLLAASTALSCAAPPYPAADTHEVSLQFEEDQSWSGEAWEEAHEDQPLDTDQATGSPCAAHLTVRATGHLMSSWGTSALRVTAGHGSCGAGSGKLFGQLSGNVDAAIYNNPPADGILYVKTPQGNWIHVAGSATANPGDVVCNAGGASPERCAPVLTNNISPSYVPGGHGFLLVDTACQPGDSGSPWFVIKNAGSTQVAYAIGTTSGVRIASGGTKWCIVSSTDALRSAVGGAITFTPRANCGELLPGLELRRDETLTSCNGVARLVHQGDGNVVLHRNWDNAVLWASHTGGSSDVLSMQLDGNLVLYGPSGPMWQAHTGGQDGAHLALQEDCNMVVYKNGAAVFKTNTELCLTSNERTIYSLMGCLPWDHPYVPKC